MSDKTLLKIRIEAIVKDPKKSKLILIEIEQYEGRLLCAASNVKLNEPNY